MIRYQNNLEGITSDQLEGFFVGWSSAPSPKTMINLLRAAYSIQLAIDDDITKVIGFTYSISDGILCAYVPLLEVQPGYQGQDVGRELMKRLLKPFDSMYMVDVVCDKEIEPFYSSLGFTPSFAMIQRNYGNQSGAGNS
jgi:GNAT superfamily N-acetyltransferase